MEGNHSSACLMIWEYKSLVDFLRERSELASEPELKLMLRTMILKTNNYLEEALDCDAILLSTILNPSYRLLMFQHWFSSCYSQAKNLLEQSFNNWKAEREAILDGAEKVSSPPVEVPSQLINQRRKAKKVDFFPDAAVAPPEDKLAAYLSGKYKLPTDQAKNCLKWWKVFFFIFISQYSACQLTFLLFISGSSHWVPNISINGERLPGLLSHLGKCGAMLFSGGQCMWTWPR